MQQVTSEGRQKTPQWFHLSLISLLLLTVMGPFTSSTVASLHDQCKVLVLSSAASLPSMLLHSASVHSHSVIHKPELLQTDDGG